MASVTTTSKNMPKLVMEKLLRMRSKLTRWILIHGLGRWLIAILAVLAFDVALDRFFKMDFAQRLVMLIAMGVAAVVYFGIRVVKPLFSRLSDDALIYEVENKNPELKESLLSSVQLSRDEDWKQWGTSAALAAATIEQGIEKSKLVDFSKALDLSRHLQNWLLLMAGLAMAAGVGVGISQTEFLKTWFNRNILLLEDQWPQATYLEIVGAVDGELILPRGGDHRQLVRVTEDSLESDVSVSLETSHQGGKTFHQMKPTGKLNGREHVFVFHNVSSPFRFRASGGDDVTSWVDVKLVEPPSVIQLDLNVLMPAYTGVTHRELQGVGPHSVLVGSRLDVGIRTNKALSAANLKLDQEVYPMQLGEDDTQFNLTIPGEGQALVGGEYEFELVDSSGMKSSRRSKFRVTIKEDDVPKIRASLLGISGLVSARANLPASYQAVDSYGLTQLAFDATWKTGDNDEKTGQRELVFAEPRPGEDGLPIRQVKDFAELDLELLGLSPGTSFRFSVTAKDNHPGKPNVGRSQEFLLRVVTDEELRADLLRREIEQRKAFDDQAYQVQLALMTEIQAIAARTRQDGVSQEEFDSKREAALIALVRKQKGVGTVLDRVANRFEEFLVEVKNNRLDEAENQLAPDQRIETRFDERIIGPIRQLDSELISLASRQFDNARRAIRDQSELEEIVDQSVELQLAILEEMKRILSAMADSESFQEIINDFLEVKSKTTEIKGGIKDRIKPDDGIFDGDDDDIFDK
ncbi:MAG: hypothetical protein OSA89_11185 [Mariniblastus sp.]|nr:hypothetical protein [Mariniblastus sp.]